MQPKKKNDERLSRREFFKTAVQKTLPFMAALSLPSFILSCGDDDPINTPKECTDCTNSCLDSCSKVCSESCENGNNSTSCTDCGAGCENTCSGECTSNCETGCSETCSAECKDGAKGEPSEQYIAVDLGLGVLWASFNIGATAEEEYGGYYKWADPTGENSSEDLNDYPSANPPSNICDTQYDIAKIKWGNGWRLPSQNEAKELINKCTWKNEQVNGIMGKRIIGKNGNSIFLPFAGHFAGGKKYNEGTAANYWTGTLDTEIYYDAHGNQRPFNFAYVLNIGNGPSGGTANNSLSRIASSVVRPVKDSGNGCKDCASGCSSGCANTCDRDCTAYCSSSCTASCGTNCEGGCENTCYGGCSTGCENSCEGGCFAGCTGGCTYGCGTGCTAVAG